MSEGIFVILGLFWLIGTAVALFGIFKPFIKNTRRLHYVIAAPIIFLGIPVAMNPLIPEAELQRQEQEKTQEEKDEAKTEQIRQTMLANPIPVRNYSKWSYSTETYGIDEKKTTIYYVTSNNQIDLDFPYGKTNMDLHVRYSNGRLDPTGGVYVTSEGQFFDGRGDVYGGTVRVKFDDGPVKTYRYLDPADNSTGIAFIESDASFVRNLKKSKKLKIEIDYYQNGSQVFEFDTSGLNEIIQQNSQNNK